MAEKRAANQKMLEETNEIQDKTKETIYRIQRQAAEAEELGTETIEELRRQGTQMDDINAELDNVSSKLDQSSALQSRFDRWAGNWLGGKKAAAHREAAAEIASRSSNDYSKIKEVFQNEKYDSLGRTWKKGGMVLCNDPSMPCTDLFDPQLQEGMEASKWNIDFSLSGIDAEGWTYAYDFATLNKSGAGETAPKWNTYVRRRKWRFLEKTGGGSEALNKVRERNNERYSKQSNSQTGSEKIGYIPRNKQTKPLATSGLSSAGFVSKGKRKDQEQLDAESASELRGVKQRDVEIDAGIDAIARQIDNLGSMATTIKDQVVDQNSKLEKMEDNMQRTTEKQTVVNARQRYLLK